MVGWGFAFGRGLVIFVWTIVWSIVAAIIALLITGGTLITAFSDPTVLASNPTALIGTFLFASFISFFIAIIGFYASLGLQPTQTVLPSLKKYCSNCGTSVPGGTVRCPNCNNSL